MSSELVMKRLMGERMKRNVVELYTAAIWTLARREHSNLCVRLGFVGWPPRPRDGAVKAPSIASWVGLR